MKKINLYTDGSCLGNPGPGGYGVVLVYGEYVAFDAGEYDNTTNNEMEIMAVLKGLKKIKSKHIPTHVYSDSDYVVNGITTWIETWRNKGWKTSRGDAVKHKDLWIELDKIVKEFTYIKFIWVKAHNGHQWNEWADELARTAAEIAKQRVLIANT